MKKALLLMAMVFSASTANASEVHKDIPAHECVAIKSSLPSQNYVEFTQSLLAAQNFRYPITILIYENGIMFEKLYINEKTKKIVSFNRQTHKCHMYVGTLQDLFDHLAERELKKQQQEEHGRNLSKKYGV